MKNIPKPIDKIVKEKQLNEIKKVFNWKQYMYLNPNLKQDFNSDCRAWFHFRKFGFDLGLRWNCETEIEATLQDNKVLIVMPTYNRAHKIHEVIQMIIKQTFTNWIFLIIDDGSTQDNKMVFYNIKHKYKNNNKIVFFENDINCHIAKTLNRGIDYLMSNYFTHFTWISDDNVYYSDFINILVSNNKYFTYSSFHSQSIENKITINKRQYNNCRDVITNWGGCASFMWTKQAIKQIGYYNETVPCCEDYEYIIRTFKINSTACSFIDMVLMKYIYHTDSLYIKNKSKLVNIINKINNNYLNNTISYNSNNIISYNSNISTNLYTGNILIVSTYNLLTGTLFLQNCLKKLGLTSHIIFNIEDKYSDYNFYIILFSNSTKIPKNYIFWQIEQTSQYESPVQKFTETHILSMNKSICIFEISSDNIPHYLDKIIEPKKIRYNQLPFSDMYNLDVHTDLSKYDYDIVFFGAKSSRRMYILNKLHKILSKKYRILYLFGVNGEERDNILKKTKYLLNIHYYENSKLECDRFNIAINCNCLILSEDCIGDIQNKENYKFFVSYFNNICCEKNNEINIEELINTIEYNLQDNIFFEKKQNYIEEKQKLERTSLYYLHKNLVSLNYFKNLDHNIHFYISEPIYCLSLIEDDTRYNIMMKQSNVVPHTKFPALRHKIGIIGCAMSYYTLIYNCKKQNIDSITIFEDDTLFKDTFNYTHQIVKEFLRLVQWDIFNGYCCLIENESDILGYYLYKGVTFLKIKKMVGMVFNIYNNSVYDNILAYDYNYSNNNPQDGYNQIDRIINTDNMNIFICYPSLVSILPVLSSLDLHDRKKSKLPDLFEYEWYKNTENKTNTLIENFIQNNDPVEIPTICI